MDAVIDRIHQSPIRLAITTAGGGASAIAALTSVPGCSNTLVDAVMPYSNTASEEMLDCVVAQRVSSEIGSELAHHAYRKAERLVKLRRDEEALAGAKPLVVGLGCTAAVQTGKDTGSFAAYVTCWHIGGTANFALRLPSTQSRAVQEATIGALLVYAITRADPDVAAFADANLAAFGLPPMLPHPGCPEGGANNTACLPDSSQEGLVYTHTVAAAPDPFVLLLGQKINSVLFNSQGVPRLAYRPHTAERWDGNSNIVHLLVPGSFNPLHWGHTELARVASNVVLRKQQAADPAAHKKRVVVTYEISASIVGKRDLGESDLVSRVQQFVDANTRVAVTTARMFVEKAAMFPGHGLVVGIDTAERVLDPAFYGGSLATMKAALEKIRSHGCYFVVGGRQKAEDADEPGTPKDNMVRNDSFSSSVPAGAVWADATRLAVPDGFRDMFVAIAQEDFRVDISSTELRARRGDVKEMKLYVNIERIYNELRELGIGVTDPVTVEQLLPFDQYHYFGVSTVDDGAERAKIAANTSVLDVGSGLGGPARYLANKYKCRVTAVELQSDVSRVAEDFTRRVGLSHLVEHRCADFVAPERFAVETVRGAYDVVVSWLVFVHIPDRATLLQRCFDALKPGGRLFVEDFHALGAFSEQELHMLNADVHCPYLPTLAEFERQCRDAGFATVEMRDLTKDATVFAQERFDGYNGAIERHERVHGKETAQGMLHFYRVISTLFNGGKFGLCRVLAHKPL